MVRKFRSNKTIGALKVRGKVTEISFEAKFLRKAMKSQEIRRNSLALLLRNTVALCHAPSYYIFLTRFWMFVSTVVLNFISHLCVYSFCIGYFSTVCHNAEIINCSYYSYLCIVLLLKWKKKEVDLSFHR